MRAARWCNCSRSRPACSSPATAGWARRPRSSSAGSNRATRCCWWTACVSARPRWARRRSTTCRWKRWSASRSCEGRCLRCMATALLAAWCRSSRARPPAASARMPRFLPARTNSARWPAVSASATVWWTQPCSCSTPTRAAFRPPTRRCLSATTTPTVTASARAPAACAWAGVRVRTGAWNSWRCKAPASRASMTAWAPMHAPSWTTGCWACRRAARWLTRGTHASA